VCDERPVLSRTIIEQNGTTVDIPVFSVTTPLVAGRNVIRWRAQDLSGNASSVDQVVTLQVNSADGGTPDEGEDVSSALPTGVSATCEAGKALPLIGHLGPGVFGLGPFMADLWAFEDRAYITEELGNVYIVDLSVPTAPTVVTKWIPPCTAGEVSCGHRTYFSRA
jgi:hypothetical protein